MIIRNFLLPVFFLFTQSVAAQSTDNLMKNWVDSLKKVEGIWMYQLVKSRPGVSSAISERNKRGATCDFTPMTWVYWQTKEDTLVRSLSYNGCFLLSSILPKSDSLMEISQTLPLLLWLNLTDLPEKPQNAHGDLREYSSEKALIHYHFTALHNGNLEIMEFTEDALDVEMALLSTKSFDFALLQIMTQLTNEETKLSNTGKKVEANWRK